MSVRIFSEKSMGKVYDWPIKSANVLKPIAIGLSDRRRLRWFDAVTLTNDQSYRTDGNYTRVASAAVLSATAAELECVGKVGSDATFSEADE